MAGRYGSDQLNNALLLLAIVLMVIEWVMKWNWMSMFILALFILCYFRMLLAQHSGAICRESEIPPEVGACLAPPA